MGDGGAQKNDSEILFEQYLTEHGIAEWDYEPEIKRKNQRPDYRVNFRGAPLFFEVKEFRRVPSEPLPAGGAYDPYPPIREKINAAREKFKEFKEFCCSLVLRNVNAWLIDLDVPWIVQGAMLGDFGLRFAVDTKSGIALGEPTWTYLKRGKMVDYKRMQPQNTTISSLVVLELFPVGQRIVAIETARREKEIGRALQVEEFFDFIGSLRTKGLDIRHKVLRAVVHENPYARIPLPREIFVGPYDERFGPEGDHLTRVFVGAETRLLEAEEAALK